MKTAFKSLIAAAVLAALAVGGYAIYQFGLHQGATAAPSAPPTLPAMAADDPGSSIAAGEAATRRHIEQLIHPPYRAAKENFPVLRMALADPDIL